LAILLVASQLSFAAVPNAEPDGPIRRALEQTQPACAAPALHLAPTEREALLDFYRQHGFAGVWNAAPRLDGLLQQLELITAGKAAAAYFARVLSLRNPPSASALDNCSGDGWL
jgi:hypothetical protein